MLSRFSISGVHGSVLINSCEISGISCVDGLSRHKINVHSVVSVNEGDLVWLNSVPTAMLTPA